MSTEDDDFTGEEEEEEEEEAPELSDTEGYVISDAKGGYSVAREEEELAVFVDFDDAINFISADMEQEKYWPEVYYVNDHGNINLIAITKKRGKVTSQTVKSWV